MAAEQALVLGTGGSQVVVLAASDQLAYFPAPVHQLVAVVKWGTVDSQIVVAVEMG